MAEFGDLLARVTGFDWDGGNAAKNEERHGGIVSEAEQVFFNRPVLLAEDAAHSRHEHRYQLLGRTDDDRFLSIIFTVHRDRVRVISARAMSRKERSFYAKVPFEPR